MGLFLYKELITKIKYHIIIDSVLVVYDTNYHWKKEQKEPRKKDIKYGYLCNELSSKMAEYGYKIPRNANCTDI